MKKLTLTLDALEVDSFEVLKGDGTRSTVFGYDVTLQCSAADCETGDLSGCCGGSRVDPTCHGWNSCSASCPDVVTCNAEDTRC